MEFNNLKTETLFDILYSGNLSQENRDLINAILNERESSIEEEEEKELVNVEEDFDFDAAHQIEVGEALGYFREISGYAQE